MVWVNVMRLIPYALSDVGRKRAHNEDNFLVAENLGLFAVADGMGGHQAGEMASRLAIEKLRAHLPTVKEYVLLGDEAANYIRTKLKGKARVVLLTHFVVREDAHLLFGFATNEILGLITYDAIAQL